jgi:periplasmic protein TonB
MAVVPGWNAQLATWLAANRRYPDAARRRGEEGEVAVRFTVAADGRVSQAVVVKSSGTATLDAAALRLLQGATLPGPGVEATRTVRLRYRLRD